MTGIISRFSLRGVLLGMVACLVLPLTALGQEAAPVDPLKDARNVETQRTWLLHAGLLGDLKSGGQWQSYYQLEYKGKLLSQQGSPFQIGNANLIGAPNLAPLADPGGDTHDLSLRLERGSVTGKGDLFDLIGVQPFHIPALKDLRGTLQLSGLTSGKQLNIAGGLETRPLHPFSVFNSSKAGVGISNFLVFGVLGEQQNRDASLGGNTDVLKVTYRAFAGQAFGWRQSNQTHQITDAFIKQILAAANSYDAAKPWLDSHPTTGNLPTHIHVALKFLIAKPESKDNWDQAVREFATAYTKKRIEHPTSALWLESSGWYTMSGAPGPHRFSSVVAATATYWLDPDSSNDLKLQLRYEYGYESAAPTVLKHQLLLTLGINF